MPASRCQKIKQYAVVILLTLSAKGSTSEPHTLSLRRSSENDLKEYFLFPVELLPMTSACSLFTVCTNSGFKAGAMNTHISLSNDNDLFSLFGVSGQNCCQTPKVMVFHFPKICHGKRPQKTIFLFYVPY